ncbi:alpha/beta hydrolase family protein [Paenibacillus cisolokensis]|uniref:alpha/beta hydrolase family protein n=1 Tax=Paenibacillus cisolokensis TaxID=1658519 RepID=UPI003D2A8FE3
MSGMKKWPENVAPFDGAPGEMLTRWTYEAAMRAASEGQRARAALRRAEDVVRRQRAIREGLERCIGGLPAGTSPLPSRVAGWVNADGFRVENVIYEPRPGVHVPANVYVPDGVRSPSGAVLLLCGHREKAKRCDEYQMACQYLVREGLVVMVIDPIGQGERFSAYDRETMQPALNSVQDHENAGRRCLPLGDSLARYMLHDAVRAVDYLSARPEVDPRRIGAIGHSGGGMQTALLMMYDSRIAAAAPAGFITTRPHFIGTGKTQDAEQKWPGFSALGFDHEDILLAMAPRPVLVLATTGDSVPVAGTRQAVESCRRFWELMGGGGRLELFEDEGRHRFTEPLMRAAARFFAEHLLEAPVRRPEEPQRVAAPSDAPPVAPLPPEKLLCTRGGQILGEVEGARSIYDEIGIRLSETEAERLAITEPERKMRALEWLSVAVRRNRQPADPDARVVEVGDWDGWKTSRMIWRTRPGLAAHALLLRDARYAGCPLPITIAVWDGGTERLAPHADWIAETCSSGRAAWVLDPAGVGALLPYAGGPDNDPYRLFGALDRLTDELMWLGDSMAALRVHDVLQAIALALAKTDDVELFGDGRYAVYAGWAALLETRIRRVRMKNRPIASLAGWISSPVGIREQADTLSFILPGMLRYFDLPDMDRWLAEEGRLIR